jgi:hypothetical protein
MADNRHKYGFRFHSTQGGGGRPACVEMLVASAYQGNVGGGNVGISIGDPVDLLSTGFVELSNDTATRDTPFGVVMNIANAKVDINGKARPASYLPGATSYALEETTSKLIVAPFSNHIWELDVDDAVTATTLAAYRALVGENVDFVYSRDTSNADKPRANPVLDISEHATTAALLFRIVGVSKSRENADFSGANVKLLVQLNQGLDPTLNGATGMAGV